eukprot:comp41630_c0_seq1/m.47447 comp41630_c0_seq1/g.47447  ORF comp41630_c0_seq1/g.47447 comp41630_c0_seq1/m.47447 type:complete len:386 (-) comp41630_c0_seq1:3-1160(-)
MSGAAASQSPVDRHKQAGNECFKKGDYKDAAKAYTKAISLTDDPELLGTLYSNRAAAYEKLEKFDQALADTNSAIKYRPNWAKGYFRKGEAESGLKQYRLALESYENALRLGPDDRIRQRIAVTRHSVENEDMGLVMLQLQPGVHMCMRTLNPILSLVYQFARSMANFIYVVGDAKTRECVVVDLCWDMDSVLKVIKDERLKLVGAIVTHYHFDHTGGKPPPPYDQYPVTVDGVGKLAKKIPGLKVYVGPGDYKALLEVNGVPEDQLVATEDNQELVLGDTRLRFIHTPGHTPGSQCILINDRRMLTGDTVFIGACGRLDFPDSDPHQMYLSMQKLRQLDGSIVLYPGHNYGGRCTTLGREKEKGVLLGCGEELWKQQFVGPPPA